VFKEKTKSFSVEMDPKEATQYLKKLFAKAGKVDNSYRTNEERLTYLSETGARIFKRKALGLGRTPSRIKSLDEVAKLFVKMKIASSFDEAIKLVPKVVIANNIASYRIPMSKSGFIIFDEVKNSAGCIKYRISAHV